LGIFSGLTSGSEGVIFRYTLKEKEMLPREKVQKLTDTAHAKYDGYAYAAGYFGAMVAEMLEELRLRGQHEMAEYHERQLDATIKTLQG